MTSNWTKISKNPVSQEVLSFLYNELKQRRGERIFDFMEYLRGFVAERTVLDIGVVEHDVTHIESSNWKHKKIKEFAKEVMGVDILSEEVALLQKRGFNVVEVDATSDTDLGLRFDRVFIGDVIEHVDNPINLLKFAARHLKNDGLILVTTPNPFCFFRRGLMEGTIIANAEHVCSVSPCNAIEIGRRAELELHEYRLLQSRGVRWTGRTFTKLRDVFWADSEFFSGGFCYIFKKS
jgi:2-polyprenyl-3-methyl-5-hydroxy-6-metoxy-1,4-benzoquinol methylase